MALNPNTFVGGVMSEFSLHIEPPSYWLTYHKEPSHEILDPLGQRFVWKLCFNILMGLQYERSKLKGQRSTLTFGTYQ